MDYQILIGLLFTILPIFELRVGLPIVVEYVLRNNLPIWPYFVLVVLINILVIFFIFFFFDFIHNYMMRFSWYQKIIGKLLYRIRKKIDKINKTTGYLQFVILALFVAIPLPGTGAWTGTLIAWATNLNRFKSVVAISIGIIIAGMLILLASLSFFKFF
jgi:uncharacterized membrane protein